MELLGWIGSGLLAFCAVPEAYLAWRRKGSSLTWTFLSIWWLGEVLILIPVLIDVKVGFLLFNYIINILLISIIMYYKYKGEK